MPWKKGRRSGRVSGLCRGLSLRRHCAEVVEVGDGFRFFKCWPDSLCGEKAKKNTCLGMFHRKKPGSWVGVCLMCVIDAVTRFHGAGATFLCYLVVVSSGNRVTRDIKSFPRIARARYAC